MEEMIGSLVDALEELGIEYVIVGGVAVVSWGNLRTTRDVDVVILIREGDAGRFAQTLVKHDFDVNEEDVIKSLEEKTHLTVFDKLSDFHVDVKGVYGKEDERVLERRREVQVGERRVYLASPEEIIAMKLVYGSEQDLKDAESVYLRQKDRLDIPYLRELCKELGVLLDFEKLVEELGGD